MNQRQQRFSLLIKPHFPSLHSTAMRMARNKSDAEDLVQEALYKAYRALDQYQANTNFRAWVFRILVNTFITAYRKAVKAPQKVSYDDLEDFALYKKSELINPDQVESKGDITEAYFEDDIKTALENLPYQFRLVVLLCDVEGFSYNEIANIINSPLGTVMSRLYRGRKLLQRTLWSYAQKRGYINENTKRKK
jgi:RNA polymerase sigma-70 factor, ECF subfamily